MLIRNQSYDGDHRASEHPIHRVIARFGRICRSKMKNPGEDQRDGKADGQDDNDERNRPGRQIEAGRDVVDDLKQHPRHDSVGRGHAVDMAAFQLGEEITHPRSQSQKKSSALMGRHKSAQPFTRQ